MIEKNSMTEILASTVLPLIVPMFNLCITVGYHSYFKP